jgi:hypothetical protein
MVEVGTGISEANMDEWLEVLYFNVLSYFIIIFCFSFHFENLNLLSDDFFRELRMLDLCPAARRNKRKGSREDAFAFELFSFFVGLREISVVLERVL